MGFARLLVVLRPLIFVLALLAAIVCLLDWLVRTRRINPFGRIARVIRRTVDPLLAPLERRVVRSGGLPSNAPWWALATVVVAGILLLVMLGWLEEQMRAVAFSVAIGPAGILRLLVAWIFGILQLALIVRVISSWLRVGEYSPWIRWAVVLTEPILKPLRRIVPSIGMIDITPLVAWLLLILVRGFVLGML